MHHENIPWVDYVTLIKTTSFEKEKLSHRIAGTSLKNLPWFVPSTSRRGLSWCNGQQARLANYYPWVLLITTETCDLEQNMSLPNPNSTGRIWLGHFSKRSTAGLNSGFYSHRVIILKKSNWRSKTKTDLINSYLLRVKRFPYIWSCNWLIFRSTFEFRRYSFHFICHFTWALSSTNKKISQDKRSNKSF